MNSTEDPSDKMTLASIIKHINDSNELHITTEIQENILPLIKSFLLELTITNSEDEETYINIFKAILHVYSQLHQLPKLFVKLMLALTEVVKTNSGNEFLNNGQILCPVLNSLKKCMYNLPSAQIVEFWKIFNETYFVFRDMSKINVSCTGPLFFVSQLFSNFLLHARLFDGSMPSKIAAQIPILIKETSEELSKNTSILKKKGANLSQSSFLMMCSTLGEVHFVYNCKEIPTFPDTLNNSYHPLEFSMIHAFLDDTYTSIIEEIFQGENKLKSYFIFHLLIQKIKIFMHKNHLNEQEEINLHSSLSLLLEHIKENNASNSPWNFDLCTLNESNYGTAIWELFLKSLPLILNFLTNSEVFLISSLLCDAFLQEISKPTNFEEVNEKILICQFLASEYFQESKRLQTAFISSLWNYGATLLFTRKRTHDEMDSKDLVKVIFEQLGYINSKWIKYSDTVPKSDMDINNLWNHIKSICLYVNELLESEKFLKQKIKVKETSELLELIGYLPLQCLLPGNQLQCIIGLSLILFLLPQHHNPSKMQTLAMKLFKILIAIFEGVRSIWLFDFVNNKYYIKTVINTLNRLFENKEIILINLLAMDSSSKYSNLPKKFLEHLISLSTLHVQSLLGVEDYFSELACGSEETPASTLAVFTLLERINLLFKRKFLKPDLKEACEKLLHKICLSFIKKLESKKFKHMDDYVFILYIKSCSALIENSSMLLQIDENLKRKLFKKFPKLINISLLKLNKSQDEEFKHVYLQFISQTFLHYQELTDFIPSDFIENFWKAIYFYLKEKNCFQNATNSSKKCEYDSSSKLALDSHHECPVSSHKDAIFKEIHMARSNSYTDKTLDYVVFNDDDILALQSLMKINSEDVLQLIFKSILETKLEGEEDVSQLNTNNLHVNLFIIKNLVKISMETRKFHVISSFLHEYLLFLHTISSKACESPDCLMLVAIPILKFAAFIIKNTKDYLPSYCYLDNLHFCANFRLENLTKTPFLFIPVFNGFWEIVYNLLTHHPKVVLRATAPFLSYISVLLKSLVKIGTCDIMKSQDDDAQHQLIFCSQNLDRLLTMIAKHKTEVARLVPYLIADYVDSVQHVTLHSAIKLNLISGINRLLYICSEESKKMLAVNINQSCLEIYKNLLKNYQANRFYGSI